MKIKPIALVVSCLSPVILQVSPSYSEPSSQSPSTLHEVIVSSSRTAMPLSQVGSSVTVIDAEEIQQRGYIPLVDLLRT